MLDHLLQSPTDLFRTALARARAIADGKAAPELAPPLGAWVDKVARHAYRCTDEDVAELARAGHDEDAVYDATVGAALGAAWSRFERGLSLLGSRK